MEEGKDGDAWLYTSLVKSIGRDLKISFLLNQAIHHVSSFSSEQALVIEF
jgi:hypothetical protein